MAEIRLIMVGGGNMGKAILVGALDAGVLGRDQVVVVEPDPRRRADLAALGLLALSDIPAALARAEPATQVMLAVKPQVFPATAPLLRPWCAGGDGPAAAPPGVAAPRTVVSIMAGVPRAAIVAALGCPAVVRCMPNLAVEVRQGMTAIARDPRRPGDADLAAAIFRALGSVLFLEEDQLDAFTAVAGSGPAYLFLVAEAMIAGAARLGLSPEEADTAVRQTLLGAALLLRHAAAEPSHLRAAVTSPGGTTAAALAVLESRGVAEAFGAALAAARDRGRELGAGPQPAPAKP